MQKLALAVGELLMKAFTGKSSEKIKHETLCLSAGHRLRIAHLICKEHDLEIPLGGSFFWTTEVMGMPAAQNYLHHLGYADAVCLVPAQSIEGNYHLGYQEGQKDLMQTLGRLPEVY